MAKSGEIMLKFKFVFQYQTISEIKNINLYTFDLLLFLTQCEQPGLLSCSLYCLFCVVHDAIYRLRMCSVTEKVDRGLDDLDCSVGFRLSWRTDGVAIFVEYCMRANLTRNFYI